MGLVQAGFLAAMAALAVPVLVHLLSRWQVRRLEFGTMQFLQEVIHDSAHRRRIRRWLLLTTRMALVALLAMLFARPFIPERSLRDGERLRIVLVDRSASMTMPGQSGRLLDDAIAAGVDAVQRAGDDTQVQWAWFDRHVEALPEGTSRPTAPRTTSGDTDYFAALAWARDRLSSNPTTDAEVIVITDLQQSGLATELIGASELGFPRDVPIRVIDVGRAAASNLAITNLTAGATQFSPGKPVTVLATLFNYGSLPAEDVPITATANNGERSVRLKKTLNVANEQAEEIGFSFEKLEAGRWQVTVDIDLDDDLASDNRRVTAFAVAAPIKVLVLDPGSEDSGASAVSFFLATALQQGVRSALAGSELSSSALAGTALAGSALAGSALAGSELAKESELSGIDAEMPVPITTRSRFEAEVVYLEDDGARSFAKSEEALIVVSDAGAIPQRMIQQLETYTLAGGRLLVFAGSQIAEPIADLWTESKLAPGKLVRAENAAAMPFRIVSISSRGSMLEPFRDPQHGDLGRLAFNALFKTDVDPATHVVAWFDHERPALTEHSLGKGRIAWFLSSADNKSSNWTTSPLYLPLVQQMAADLLGMTGEGPIRFRSVGDLLADELNPSIQPVSATLPNSESVDALYFEQPGFQTRDNVSYAINTLAKESDTARVDAQTFINHFGLVPASDEGLVAAVAVESERRNELWPWLAAMLVVLLVVEFCLSNRTPA